MGLRTATDEPDEPEEVREFQGECLDCGATSLWFEHRAAAENWRREHQCKVPDVPMFPESGE